MADILDPIRRRLHDSRAEVIKLKTELEDAVCQNTALKTRADENDEQVDGYRRLCDGLSELVADIEAGDGFYGNDPIEMLVDIRNRHDEIKAELADRDLREGELVTDIADLHEKLNELRMREYELREAAAWYWECFDLWEDGVSMNNPFWADAEYELSNNIVAAGSALRALLDADKSNP